MPTIHATHRSYKILLPEAAPGQNLEEAKQQRLARFTAADFNRLHLMLSNAFNPSGNKLRPVPLTAGNNRKLSS